MIAPADLEHCREVIRTGSLSFHAASKLLPTTIRDPALVLYAFCRLADDEVDEGFEKGKAVIELQERLDLAYRGTPRNAPEDRAFAAIIEQFDMPRALPEALLEGLAWDAVERRYHTLSEVREYSSRVASAVGAMMCVLMRVRDADALARMHARAASICRSIGWKRGASALRASFLRLKRRLKSASSSNACWQRHAASISARRPGSARCPWARAQASLPRAISTMG